MSVGFRHHSHGSGYIDPKLLDKVEAAIKNEVTIKRGVDVPFSAGYSEDGKTVYVDKDVPETFKLHGKELSVDRYLVIHEAIEKCLMDGLGLPYQFAHELATICEEKAVQADGFDLSEYNREWDKVIRKVGSRAKYPNVPKDLDTEPYTDESDTKDERKMDGGTLIGGKGSYEY